MLLSLLVFVSVLTVPAEPVLSNAVHASGRLEYGRPVTGSGFDAVTTPYRAYLASTVSETRSSLFASLSWSAFIADTFRAETPLPHVDELVLQWFPLPFAGLRAGRLHRHTGFAEIFSPLDLFTGTDFERLTTGQFDGISLARDMGELSLYGGVWNVTVTAAWDVPRITVPRTSAREFPDRYIPRTVDSRSTETVYELGSLSMSDIPESDRAVDTWGIEAGVSGWFWDLSVAAVSGVLPVPATEARVLFPDGLLGPYDVELHPVWIDGLVTGIAAQATAGAFRFWAETAYTGKMTVSVPYDGPGLVAVPALQEDRDLLDVVAGVSYQSASPRGLLFLETRREWLLGGNGDAFQTAFGFTDYAGFGAGLAWPDPGLEAHTLALVSTTDYSGALVASLSWEITEKLSAAVTCGALKGDESTIFGQLEWPLWVEVNTELRF